MTMHVTSYLMFRCYGNRTTCGRACAVQQGGARAHFLVVWVELRTLTVTWSRKYGTRCA